MSAFIFTIISLISLSSVLSLYVVGDFCSYGGLNFTTLSGKDWSVQASPTSIFYLNPCAELIDIPACGVLSTGCFVAHVHTGIEVDDLADIDTQQWSWIDDSNHTEGVQVAMQGETDCLPLNASQPIRFQTTLQFICDRNATVPSLTVDADWLSCQITYLLETILACPPTTTTLPAKSERLEVEGEQRQQRKDTEEKEEDEAADRSVALF